MKAPATKSAVTSFAEGIVVVGASAGSGKTYRLTSDVARYVDPNEEPTIAVEGLLAVTFTARAADELSSRIRQRLVQTRAFDRALKLPLARVGTVHSVCLQLVKDLAIEAGLPPGIEVMPADGDRQLRRTLEACLPAEKRERMNELAYRLQIAWDNKTFRSNWLTFVFQMLQAARGNRIPPDRLPAMAERSIEGLLAMLPRTLGTAEQLDHALRDGIKDSLALLKNSTDTTMTTEAAVKQLKSAGRRIANGNVLTWSDWLGLATCSAGKKSLPLLQPCYDAALRYEEHPRFHAELCEFIRGAFECAQLALESYADWKARRRLVDYVDMLERSLLVVSKPAVREALAAELELVVVDEFQDTSPIQLELFVELHKLAGRSIWVGDRKQCIFEFAGADPQLMDSVVQWVGASGGKNEQLEHNYRSRPALVDFCSTLFVRALARDGYSPAEVAVTAKRTEPAELSELAPLGLWHLTAKNQADEAACIAAGIARLLAAPTETPVVDRVSSAIRSVCAGDIAVLVATNAEAIRIAEALAARGIETAVARPGLLDTPEGQLLQAALGVLLDDTDAVAATKLDALYNFDGQEPDAWLNDRLKYRAALDAWNEAEPKLPEQKPSAPRGAWASALSALHSSRDVASPLELLEAVVRALDLTTIAARWPEPKQRLANLDELRALASEYEEQCRHYDTVATLHGLLGYFSRATEEFWDGDEMAASDDQFYSADANAVVLSTYHRAKGLEWPIVILGSLNRAARDDAFSLHVESDVASFDPAAPLTGRWLRFWPWPFGGKTKAPLRDRVADSPAGRHVVKTERAERARLLYVGFTRARDQLILAARSDKKGPQVTWLDDLADAAGEPLLTLPAVSDAREPHVIVGAGKALQVPARVWTLTPSDDERALSREEPKRFSRTAPASQTTTPYWITPSSAAEGWPELQALQLGQSAKLHDALKVPSSYKGGWDRFGDAVHGLFAADVPGLSIDARQALASRCLEALELHGDALEAKLIAASDDFTAWVGERWPGARWHREVPVGAIIETPEGERRVNGTIDLLLETPDGTVIIDHKSFPDPRREILVSRAQEYFPQLAAYGRCLDGVGRKPVLGYWVHFGVAGWVVEANAATK